MSIQNVFSSMFMHIAVQIGSRLGFLYLTVADPGFPIGGVHPLGGGGHGPPMQALFDENVCENERIGSHRGLHAPSMPPQIRQCLSFLTEYNQT